jgi:hypothetical protein
MNFDPTAPLLPERKGQPAVFTHADSFFPTQHWYSPAAVRELLAAERERSNAFRLALQEIVDKDRIELVLDPNWSQRISRAALDSTPKDSS